MTHIHFTSSVQQAAATVLRLSQGTLSIVPKGEYPGGWDEMQVARKTLPKPFWAGFDFFSDIKATRPRFTGAFIRRGAATPEELETAREVEFFQGIQLLAKVHLVGIVPHGMEAEHALWCVSKIEYIGKTNETGLALDWLVVECEPDL